MQDVIQQRSQGSVRVVEMAGQKRGVVTQPDQQGAPQRTLVVFELALEARDNMQKPDALVAGGVPADRCKLRKPESTVRSGSPEEGRRVEIRVQ